MHLEVRLLGFSYDECAPDLARICHTRRGLILFIEWSEETIGLSTWHHPSGYFTWVSSSETIHS